MKILALDIGAGTLDVLLYDEDKDRVENCIKMVLPSPSLIYAEKVFEASQRGRDLFVKGDSIGGGGFSHQLKRHLASGLEVFMTEEAAYTIRNNLEEVREQGFKVVKEGPPDFDGETLQINEVKINMLGGFLNGFNEDLSDIDVVAIAVQDHGANPEGKSNRRLRIERMRALYSGRKGIYPEDLAFWEDEVPPYFLRMRSAVKTAKRQLPGARILVMDTAPSAIIGCLNDPSVSRDSNVIAVNAGNGHTMASLISKRRILGVMEHHTRLLDPDKLENMLRRFMAGELRDEEIFRDGGHGLFYLAEPPDYSDMNVYVATGPNRRMLTGTSIPFKYGAPAGDVMMTGPMGLIEAAKRKAVSS